MNQAVSSSTLKNGDRFGFFHYYKVTNTDSEFFHCVDERGDGVRIGKAVIDSGGAASTSHYHTVRKASRTQIAKRIEEVGHHPFGICFLKAPDVGAMADRLDNADLQTAAKRRKIAKSMLEGERRVMHARLHRSAEDDVEMELGRYRVIDLEKSSPGKPAMRLVDTRTVEWLIHDGIKYEVR